MLRFKNYLSEEVRPTAGVKDGSVDIENLSVRGQINATLANVTAQPAVTPYIVLHRISKALAYFHIILPKRAYLEGDRGVEVVEVKQFGDRMGMTNDGQFVHSVPSKYFLFISYRLASSMGADYAAVGGVLSSVGGMFKVTAKLVDEVELQRLLSMAEVSLAEDCDAEHQQKMAKAIAPKEKMHTALGDCDCSQGDSPSTKSAVKVSMKKIEEEMSHGARELATYADNHAQLHRSSHQPIVKNLQRKHAKGTYDHGKAEKLWGYHAKRASDAYHKEHGHKFSVGERKEAAKHMAASARDDHGFGTVKEGRMPASVIKHKQKLAGMTPEEKKKHFAGKSEEELKSMARRHGYGKDSDEYSKHVTKMEEERKNDLRGACWKGYTAKGLKKKGNRMVPNCVPVEEKLTKDMSAGDVISDFVHSKDPK